MSWEVSNLFLFHHQPKAFEQYLNLEDSRLLSHLKMCSAVSRLPYDLWFKRCFAGCLPESSLQRQVFLSNVLKLESEKNPGFYVIIPHNINLL